MEGMAQEPFAPVIKTVPVDGFDIVKSFGESVSSWQSDSALARGTTPLTTLMIPLYFLAYTMFIYRSVCTKSQYSRGSEFLSRIGAEEVGPEFRGVPGNSYAFGPPYTLSRLIETA